MGARPVCQARPRTAWLQQLSLLPLLPALLPFWLCHDVLCCAQQSAPVGCSRVIGPIRMVPVGHAFLPSCLVAAWGCAMPAAGGSHVVLTPPHSAASEHTGCASCLLAALVHHACWQQHRTTVSRYPCIIMTCWYTCSSYVVMSGAHSDLTVPCTSSSTFVISGSCKRKR